MKIFKNPIYALGIAIFPLQAGVSWLSGSFIFGIGHAERPIIVFLILELVSFAFYFAAIEWVRRLPLLSFPRKRESSNGSPIKAFGDVKMVLFWIILIGILGRLVFLPSNLIQETDPYRYIWDGQTVLAGENPYKHSPAEAFKNQLAPARNVTPEIHETFGKINHPGVKTIYPPLAQYLFAVSQTLTPWSFAGWRLMILFAEIGMFILILRILMKLGMRKEWLILYAWCPLVIKQFSNSLHLDIFALLFLSLMVWAFVCDKFRLGFLSLALASAVKLFPVVLLPLAFVWVWRIQRKSAFQGITIFSLVLLLFYAPFLTAGGGLFEGLARFAGEWRVNESLFSLILHGLVHATSLSLFQANLTSRIITAGLISVCVIGAGVWLGRKQHVTDYFRACFFVIAALFFLAPTGNPWYFTWVFPFLYFAPLRSLVIFSGLVFLYYLDFHFSYRSEYHLFAWVKWIEYGLFYLILTLELLWNRKSRLFCRWQTNETLSAAR